MKLPFATVRASSDAAAPHEKAVREARVTAARRVGWEELAQAQLVQRGPARFGWLVDCESDAVYLPYRGVTFERGSARLLADQQTNLAFYVDESGWPVVVEKHRQTWSELYGRQARSAARNRART